MNDYISRKFIPDMAIEDYHGLNDFISSSHLKEMAKSPAHYRAALEAANKRTAALEFGDAAHCYILQPHEFEKRFTSMPSTIKVKRGKEFEAFQAANEGKTILSAEDINALTGMADAFSRHTTANALVRVPEGIAEMSCFFTEPSTMANCRIRPDYLPGGAIIVDYKTTENASPSEFQRSAVKYGYDIQAGFYTLGMELLTGISHRFVFIAQEKKPPYEIAVYEASPDFIDRGRSRAVSLLEQLTECRKTGVYPGYPDEIQTLDLPAWAKTMAA